MACLALWILPSCTAFRTACDGATASTSALMLCADTACALAGAGGGVGALLEGGGMVGLGVGGDGGGGSGGPVGGRDPPEGVRRTGFLLSTAFLYFETLRNSSCAN